MGEEHFYFITFRFIENLFIFVYLFLFDCITKHCMQMTYIVRTEYNAAGLGPFEVDCQNISIGRIRNIILKKNHLNN